jgi:hypothetical protein
MSVGAIGMIDLLKLSRRSGKTSSLACADEGSVNSGGQIVCAQPSDRPGYDSQTRTLRAKFRGYRGPT